MQVNNLIILNSLSNLMYKCQSILYKISHMKILYNIYFIVASHVHGARSMVYIYIKENLDRGPREDYPARG